MGNKKSGKRKYRIDEDFFSNWNPNMAYILGFTCADGNVHGRSLAWDLSNKHHSNYLLLKSFNRAMCSNYPIEMRKSSFRLRVSRSQLLSDIKGLGIVPNKKKILIFPDVPDRFLSHFIRGFLDGDGWISLRKRSKNHNEISIGFSNGSYGFMEILALKIKSILSLSKFNLRKREKITPKGIHTICYSLEFYSENAYNLLKFLFEDLNDDDLVLERKYEKYLKAKDCYESIILRKGFGRRWIEIEKETGKKMRNLIIEKIVLGNLVPKQLAQEFNISLSQLYRWMDKSGVRVFSRRGSREWRERILNSKQMVSK
tara:strand:+ start:705 stop:1646 length:942 start_codon:yes stop_codon:yes gene_type:complete